MKGLFVPKPENRKRNVEWRNAPDYYTITGNAHPAVYGRETSPLALMSCPWDGGARLRYPSLL